MRSEFIIRTDNPIISNHLVLGKKTFPGVAYIDIVYQCFAEKGFSYEELELRHLVIYEPMTFQQDPGKILLKFTSEDTDEGVWTIRVEGLQQHGDGWSDNKQLLMTAEIHRSTVITYETNLNKDDIIRSAQSVLDLEQVYQTCRTHQLVHTGYMKTDGRIFDISNAIVMEISIDREARKDADQFLFHPALIDSSAVGSGAWFHRIAGGNSDADHLYLPLYFESFRAVQPLRSNCLTRVKADTVDRKEELLSMDLEFFNEAGEKIGELIKFTNKRLRQAEDTSSGKWGEHFISGQESEFRMSEMGVTDAPQTGYNDNLESQYTLIHKTIITFLRQLLAGLLHRTEEHVRINTGYYEMGLDSKNLLEAVRLISERIGTTLSPTLLFEYTTIKQVADHLSDMYPQAFERGVGLGKNISKTEDETLSGGSGLGALSKNLLDLNDHRTSIHEDIAVIGMAGRYPGSTNLEEFWSNLTEGKDLIREIPKDRWNWEDFESFRSPSGKALSKWGGFIDDPDCFDASFFRVTPRDAETLDPQERLFLETCWEAVEDAGYTPDTLVNPVGKTKRRSVGVFAGVMHKDYTLVGASAGKQFPIALNNAPIANRVSYFCNFHGPSMTIDTVCSSSLTAVHLALNSLALGECEVALAGGVNLSLHPGKYLSYGLADMHASDGRCRTFGKGGDGYVSGEGVGTVVLKSLRKAEEDGDHIYAVIKGSVINHVGAVSGITVPSPVAQGEMIETCLEKTGIDPRTISYIEAHGTGTSLGDPIEIQGLEKAFRRYTEDVQYCSIGSVKSNIGHAESAAGIGGLHKVILQLHHRTLVPSLHSSDPNPHIDFARSPFYVQQKTEAWRRPILKERGEEKEYPRRAGISSFGATGANAHLILEEYISAKQGKDERKIGSEGEQPILVPLSAKNKERLSAYAAKLLDYLRGGKRNGLVSEMEAHSIKPSLEELAFTLQVGRVAMEERVAIIVRNHSELMNKLTWIASGEENYGQDGIWQGRVYENGELISSGSTSQHIREMTGEELARIARLWAQGAELEWLSFYQGNHPVRTSLPTYPFAKERYWVPDGVSVESESGIEIPNYPTNAYIHPLLQHNTSQFGEIRYTSVFTGEEFFLANHLIHGQRVLPGVVYLEMVRVAVKQETAVPDNHIIQFKHVHWANKAVAEEGNNLELHVGLLLNDDDITFEVYQGTPALEGDRMVYCSGSVMVISAKPSPLVDIQSLHNVCSHSSLEAQYIYNLYQRVGIVIGPGYRGIESVQIGNRQALATLSLVGGIQENENFFLHPTLLDAALQASIGLSVGDGQPLATEVPFAFESLEIYSSCRQVNNAWIRWSEGQVVETLRKLDIDWIGNDGSVCVSLRGLTTRALEQVDHSEISQVRSMSRLSSIPMDQTGLLMLVPDWKEQQVQELKEEEFRLPEETIHLVLLYEMDELSTEIFSTRLRGAHCLQVNPPGYHLDERFQFYSKHLITNIQEMLSDRTDRQLMIQVVIGIDAENSVMAGLHGILKTAKLENPRFNGQIIEMEKGESVSSIIERLAADRFYREAHIRYKEGNRFVTKLKEIHWEQSVVGMLPWKDGGVYLLTGGAGGLGKIFAAEIARTVKNATLIIVGRSLLDLDKQAQLMELEIMGVHCEYRQADVTDKLVVEEIMHAIELEFGRLDGIIHSAGLIKDNYLINKSVDELQTVMAPKVSGLIHLDEASKQFQLDFFILFSSGASAFGNPGQADYAAANAFMDIYAEYRNDLVAIGQRAGRTLSIGWPLWKEGGMHIDATTEKAISRRTGMIPLDTEAGVQAFYQAYSLKNSRVVVLSGYTEQIRNSLQAQEGMMKNESARSGPEERVLQVDERELLENKAIHEFRKLIASVVKLPANRIEPDITFEKYGLDSIAYMQITGELEQRFGTLPKTLFFEYPSLRAITGYFVKSYRKELLRMLGLNGWNTGSIQGESGGRSVEIKKTMGSDSESSAGDHVKSTLHTDQPSFTNNNMDIAIIGLDGRYPGARTLDEFWTRLSNGDDCITEIPQDRWDHHLIFDENRTTPGKTYGKWGGFIEGISEFDSQFFHISPREAEMMDPQERLFLQSVYSAMEDAGYTRDSIGDHTKGLGGNVGVYVGVMYDEYQLYGAQEQARGNALTLSGNPATIANRVSYFCDFHGPSMTLGTMCSSSLTAIHLAVQSLRNGECEYAVAGGVNVSIHPNKYIMLGQGQFISSKGRCESFGRGGDGYVPGEGVGAVLLKPLGKAVADGDHIYGVIKATAINHGGKVAGYTVPNPNAQSAVIEKALKEGGIDPRMIGYIEAHGTGTSLGDPIEIAGLTNCFRSSTQDKQFCAIGSVKSNIGHCESAAGIAGITKILLQFKHGKLVPSLHSTALNPNIDFSETPFIVQQESSDWKRPTVGKGAGNELPRTAGVSSFGAGGANAHIILQEYMPSSDERENRLPDSRRPALIVLSAKDEDRLHEMVQRLISDIEHRPITDLQLLDMAYTLQIGREAMEQRLALTAASVDELKRKLTDYLKGQPDITELYTNKIRPNFDALSVLADEDMVHTVQAWLHKGKYTNLLQLWVKGLVIDWTILYGDWQPRRISLSTYPFAKERHWVQITTGVSSVPEVPKHVLHPLVHRNTSDLMEQRYSSTFTGQEFFLHDHRIKGRAVLPGAAYLELARAAVHLAQGTREYDLLHWKIADVTWTRPFVVDQSEEDLHISVTPHDNGDIGFVVYSSPEETSDDPVIHSQGKFVLDNGDNYLIEAPKRDIDRIRLENNQRFDAKTCYQIFTETGLQYGPSHQAINYLYVSETTVLAELALPSSAEELRSFIMHPALIDAAWQATIGFNLAAGGVTHNNKALAMPFALDELVIWEDCSEHMLAIVQYSPRSGATSSVAKFDIDLCGPDGTVCIQMKGLTCRILEESVSVSPNETLKGETATDTSLLLRPIWGAVTPETGETLPVEPERTMLVIGPTYKSELWHRQIQGIVPFEIKPSESSDIISHRLSKIEEIKHFVWVAYSGDESVELPYREDMQGSEVVILAFRFIQALLRSGYGSQEIGLTIITSQAQMIFESELIDPNQASLHGFIGSLAKEYPNWKVRLVDTDQEEFPPLSEVLALPPDKDGLPWCYRHSEWYRRELVPVELPKPIKSAYRSGGVYVVIGGAGGIGEVWSEYMIRRYQAVIIWIGRREKDAIIQAKIDRLSTLGHAPTYIQANAANRIEMHQAYNWIKQRHEQIHGVIHAAIVLADQMIANMDESNFISVFNTKAKVSLQIEQTFQNEMLDFVLFFSSINAFAGTPGQSNYVAGCAFKDAFARGLSSRWLCPVKVINWGYWGHHGAVADELYRERMSRMGIGSIESVEAMDLLEKVLEAPIDQIAYMKVTSDYSPLGIKPNERIVVYPHTEALFNSHEEERVLDNSVMRREAMIAVNHNHVVQMNELMGQLLWCQMQSMIMFEKSLVQIDSMELRAGTQQQYNRWIKESLHVLERLGYLRRSDEMDNQWLVTGKAPSNAAAVWEKWDSQKSIWMNDPTIRAQVELAETMLRALPEILIGSRKATDLMFPNSSMKLIEGIYKNNPVADYFNDFLARTAVDYIQKRIQNDPNARIRILEVGAGTGGTSATMFEMLKPYQSYVQEYCYTDISQAFLMHGEREYASRLPYVNCRILDVEFSIGGQGVDVGSYDMVIATNVLHATRHIRSALRNVKAALRPNGLLVLNEIAGNRLFTHLTFGLLEGWWLYEDPGLRIDGSPALSSKSWKVALEGENYHSIRFPAVEYEEMGQQIVVAKSDGVVRLTDSIPSVIETPLNKRVAAKNSVEPISGEGRQEMLREKTRAYLKQLVGETLKLSTERIDTSERMEKYGIDSILIVRLTDKLRTVMSDVSSTLFFEYQTIDALAEHLIHDRPQEMAVLVGAAPKVKVERTERNNNKNLSVMNGPAKHVNQPTSRFKSKTSTEQQNVVRTQSTNRDVAIIGLSGQYPMAGNAHQFWTNLLEGENCISEIPPERWDWKRYFSDEKGTSGSMYTKWGGFIRDIDCFDPKFFHISPREAMQMDPQERLFLQNAYASIEDAGYTPDKLSETGKVGVFVGVMNGNYPTGASYWSIANRVSYTLNFNGPSMAVDTACSSSLTAIILGMDSLFNGMSDVVICGGVNLIVDPVHYIKLSAAKMLSPTDRCKAFGEQADGFVDGECVGAVILKPLNKAIEDGDHIYGVIKGGSINSGGKTNGYTVPNPNAQHQAITDALKRSGIQPEMVSYVEAHGTGTALGDPIEIAGLSKAFGDGTGKKQYCAIGSVKSNIGHCESASGIAGLTKVIMQMKFETLVPSIHAEKSNPDINFRNSPFKLQTERAPWRRPVLEQGGAYKEVPLIAGISSFGAGGANTHLIIEEYRPNSTNSTAGSQVRSVTIVLSAKNVDRLKERSRQLVAQIQEKNITDDNLLDAAYTLQIGREAMEERLAFVVDSVSDLEIRLKEFIEGNQSAGMHFGQVKSKNQSLTPNVAESAWPNREYDQCEKLASMWVKGYQVDWSLLYNTTKPSRISLPSYPFANERYWVNAKREAEETSFSKDSVDKVSPLATTILEVTPTQTDSNYIQLSGLQDIVHVSPTQKPVRIELSALPQSEGISIEIKEESKPEPLLTPILERKHVLPVHQTAEQLIAELAQTLADALFMSLHEIDYDRSFIEMGMDSIIGVEWIQAINKRYGLSISATRVYDYPTLREFSIYLAGELPNRAQDPGDVIENVPNITTNKQESVTAMSMTSGSLMEELKDLLAETLFMNRADVELEKSFIEMGMDSITGVEWVQLINKRYGTNVTATKIYDYPTITEFSNYLMTELSKSNDHSGTMSSSNNNSESSHNPLTLEMVLEKVRQKAIPIDQAEQLLSSLLSK
ncbi:SDR family NAD(P)-dependent oxidoreductase [Paenibacillus sp. JNUCC31]|uniref:SDR family NAD(P)-dependent oxidoreductase n=1 Tax=Paenibacillus sp. JNUCC-31 TaxID=2777983 RepID=UPI0017839AC2|nr:SDR family NAD(P)-dependent oxidoreductase [Paenibacillus sp. JNUCC-31]QOS80422.1 SDR family NAD(P)-dependent oxidoreductase [Paenibacillus sp. JNUCC-31]